MFFIIVAALIGSGGPAGVNWDENSRELIRHFVNDEAEATTLLAHLRLQAAETEKRLAAVGATQGLGHAVLKNVVLNLGENGQSRD